MLAAVLCVLIAIFSILLWHLNERSKFFRKLNIAGPPPTLLFGNYLQMKQKSCKFEAIQEWTQQYGKVFGYMEGGKPVLVISDVDMVEEVLVKNFSNFYSRRTRPIRLGCLDSEKVNVFSANGYRWKRLRMLSTPAFSPSKLRQIARDPDILKKNLLETMLVSSIDRDYKSIAKLEHLNFHDDPTKEGKLGKVLTNEEVIQQCIIFMLAGYETSSTTLAYVTYLLTLYPECQAILTAEVDENFPGGKEPTSDSIKDLVYAECVIKETLRLYPVAAEVVGRICSKTCEIKGVTIPDGVTVVVDVWSLHRDKEIWGPDADEFKPERFVNQDKRMESAWIPFGSGPRICIGMRLAMNEMKMALVKIFQKFTFEMSPLSEVSS
ncbi:unnamed protein product [Soboliphyme baturini]|uniref:Cytochrome P450 n=1 Tax=Soboliphyme baturini TaxID=241478 RepID=A0A183IQ43_9BILA|nr:unnamed protein product [Soboliphyme baturini]